MYSQIERILSRHFQAENWQFRPDKKGLSSFQKNLLLKQYLLFEEVINKRRQNASFYNEKLKSIVRTPKETEKGAHTYLRYTISTERRDELYDYLISKGIQAEKMYDYSFGTREEYPSSHVASRNNLNIPVHSNLTKKDLEKVVRVIHEFFEME
jgi:dTDP-4-amino-4,6-dideoxygalactose transaminase